MGVIFRGERYVVTEDTDGSLHLLTMENQPVPDTKTFRLEQTPRPTSIIEVEYQDGHFDFDAEPRPQPAAVATA
jgi:hypothetical protein